MFHSKMKTALPCVFILTLLLAGCQNQSGSDSAGTPTPGSTSLPEIPDTPDSPTPPPPSVVFEEFADGHKLIYHAIARVAILVPPKLEAKIKLESANANIGFLPAGKSWTEKCEAFHELYYEAGQTLPSLLDVVKIEIGSMSIEVAYESQEFAETYLKANWPKRFLQPQQIRALQKNDLTVDEKRWTVGKSLSVAAGLDLWDYYDLFDQPISARAAQFCDLLIHTVQIGINTRALGADYQVPIVINESPKGVRPKGD